MFKAHIKSLSLNTLKRHPVDILHSPTTAWVILFASLIVTVAAWYISNKYAMERAQEHFNFRVDEAQAAIKNRMQEYEQMLRGGVGLFVASDVVSRKDWHNYVANLQIDKFWPGVQGVGFSLWIPPEQRGKHIKSVRAEGFPDYTIRPDGERATYTSIIFLEPFSGRNLRAFGFDMYSEPTRRAAMQRAIDTGDAAMSGRVTLVQETQKDVQAGFLMYLPLYKTPVNSVDERRAAIKGFVYSPFRIRDLMQGIMGGTLRELDFEIYDGTHISPDNLLFLSNPKNKDAVASITPQFTKATELNIGGNPWTIHFRTTPAFEQDTETSQPMVIAFGGVVIDVLLFYIVISLSRLRKRALLLAEEMVEKFSEQQLHFKAISDTANDGIVSADQAGNVSYFNKAAERIFGYTPNEILGRPITELMPSQYRDKHQRGFHQFTQHGQSKLTGTTLELQGQRKDGEVFPLELSLSHWTSSGAHHVNAVMRDISERKKIEKMKSEFISTVSHELRTPLTAIRGALALMGHGNKSGNFNTDEMLPLAQNNIERLSRLIDDLLDVEKLEASQLRLNLHAQPLCELLNGAVGHHRPAAETAGVTISMAGCEDAQVLADTDRLHQIMANLLSNAIKFSPRGTHIEIRTQLLDTHVKISVADQGSGIPDAFRERIFQKFAQADSSDSRAKGGTGLGLSICKMLVERHGGEIGYTTNPGHGTTFYFTLRRATPTEKAVGY